MWSMVLLYFSFSSLPLRFHLSFESVCDWLWLHVLRLTFDWAPFFYLTLPAPSAILKFALELKISKFLIFLIFL